MEKHRILWVIFSISLLLVVVLAGGLYFLRPIQDNSLATAVKSPTFSISPRLIAPDYCSYLQSSNN